nr:hypothetical protein [Providencia rettgeri]
MRELKAGNEHITNNLDFHALSIHFAKRQQAAYQQAISRYSSATLRGQHRDDLGVVLFDRDIPEIINATEYLLTFIKHR